MVGQNAGFCGNCGAPLQAGMASCSACGAPVEQADAAAYQQVGIAQTSPKPMADNPVTSDSAATGAVNPVNSAKKFPLKAIIAAVVALIVLAGAGVAFGVPGTGIHGLVSSNSSGYDSSYNAKVSAATMLQPSSVTQDQAKSINDGLAQWIASSQEGKGQAVFTGTNRPLYGEATTGPFLIQTDATTDGTMFIQIDDANVQDGESFQNLVQSVKSDNQFVCEDGECNGPNDNLNQSLNQVMAMVSKSSFSILGTDTKPDGTGSSISDDSGILLYGLKDGETGYLGDFNDYYAGFCSKSPDCNGQFSDASGAEGYFISNGTTNQDAIAYFPATNGYVYTGVGESTAAMQRAPSDVQAEYQKLIKQYDPSAKTTTLSSTTRVNAMSSSIPSCPDGYAPVQWGEFTAGGYYLVCQAAGDDTYYVQVSQDGHLYTTDQAALSSGGSPAYQASFGSSKNANVSIPVVGGGNSQANGSGSGSAGSAGSCTASSAQWTIILVQKGQKIDLPGTKAWAVPAGASANACGSGNNAKPAANATPSFDPAAAGNVLSSCESMATFTGNLNSFSTQYPSCMTRQGSSPYGDGSQYLTPSGGIQFNAYSGTGQQASSAADLAQQQANAPTSSASGFASTYATHGTKSDGNAYAVQSGTAGNGTIGYYTYVVAGPTSYVALTWVWPYNMPNEQTVEGWIVNSYNVFNDGGKLG